MLSPAIFDNILAQFNQLDKDAQLKLVEKLVQHLRKTRSSQKNKESTLMDLKGLGADIWKGIEIDEFIKEGRKW